MPEMHKQIIEQQRGEAACLDSMTGFRLQTVKGKVGMFCIHSSVRFWSVPDIPCALFAMAVAAFHRSPAFNACALMRSCELVVQCGRNLSTRWRTCSTHRLWLPTV